MSYRVVTVIDAPGGKADEEVGLACDLFGLLRWQAGFLSQEIVRAGVDRILVIQAWQSQEHFTRGNACVDAWLAHLADRSPSRVTRQTFAGHTVMAG